MTIEAMIKLLERGQRVPGTVIGRYLRTDRHNKSSLEWSVGIGELQQEKVFHSGPTLRAALMQFALVRRALIRDDKR